MDPFSWAYQLPRFGTICKSRFICIKYFFWFVHQLVDILKTMKKEMKYSKTDKKENSHIALILVWFLYVYNMQF